MAITRSTGVFLGTSETVGVSITNNASTTGSQVDLLGDDTSAGEAWITLSFTCTVATGFISLMFNQIRVSGGTYSKQRYDFSVSAANGTFNVPVGKIPVSRYMNVQVLNNATGVTLTNVSVLYELFKGS